MSESDPFQEKLERLKECLSADEDQDVAAALGMSKGAFSVRKLRGSFPDEKLFVLAATRPELAIDVTYVLTGDRSVQGAARDQLEAAARMMGSLMSSGTSTDELLSTINVEITEQKIRLRLDRREIYDHILSNLDRMTDESVGLLSGLAMRIAAADLHDELHARDEARRRAEFSGGKASQSPAGTAGSGKTTGLNAQLDQLPPGSKVLVVTAKDGGGATPAKATRKREPVAASTKSKRK